jgi:hypothetical protein
VVTIIGAAGDRDKYVCSVSPASSRSVIIAAATSRGADLDLAGSNFGECIHIFAPGEDILTASIGSPEGSLVSMTGSSASAAIVVGIWSSLLRVYSDPENLALQQRIVTEPHPPQPQEDPLLTDSDRIMLLKDSLLNPGRRSSSSPSHEIPWIGCEFTSVDSVLRHMNERYNDWRDTAKNMKKFMDPARRRKFISGQPL